MCSGQARRAYRTTWPGGRVQEAGAGGQGSGGRGSSGQVQAARVQVVGAADGQLIRTLTPELVDETRTSSARPEITASPNPAGIPLSSTPWTTVAAPAGLPPWPL